MVAPTAPPLPATMPVTTRPARAERPVLIVLEILTLGKGCCMPEIRKIQISVRIQISAAAGFLLAG
jgi:hypothetical protein